MGTRLEEKQNKNKVWDWMSECGVGVQSMQLARQICQRERREEQNKKKKQRNPEKKTLI